MTIAEVDATAHRVDRDVRVEMVVGGGDTDFHPLFALARSGTPCDAIVWLTDNVGAWPEVAPPVPVPWVLIGDQAFACPWGTVVRRRNTADDLAS